MMVKTCQRSHAKDLEALGVKIVDGGHPLSLLDNEPIIVKILVFLYSFYNSSISATFKNIN